jgi:hypothetical protein
MLLVRSTWASLPANPDFHNMLGASRAGYWSRAFFYLSFREVSMRVLLRVFVLGSASALAAALVGGVPLAGGAAQPGCVTASPKAQAFHVEEAPHEETDQWVQATFTKVRAAEGCNVPLVLPTGYDQMTPQQKILWLINNEREIRGMPPFKADTTLIQQIAYNHSKEESAYSYTGHYSPINAPDPAGSNENPLVRQDIIPLRKNNKWGAGEVIQWGTGPATSVLFWIYGDGPGTKREEEAAAKKEELPPWPHRSLLLSLDGEGCYMGVGYFAGPPFGSYTTVDTSCPEKALELPPGLEVVSPEGQAVPAATLQEATAAPAAYAPPPTADSEPPVLGQLTFSNGTATVTGVADSPKNINDTGANPLVPAIADVVFYVNNITSPPGGAFSAGGFNTVPAKQTTPGTWTAQIAVNPGQVLHAVAVDGSGNFADESLAPPTTTLAAGENTLALPAATTTPTPEPEEPEEAAAAHAAAAGGRRLAVPSSAAALVRSVDKRSHRRIAQWVRVYVDGHWRTYVPGHGANFPLYVGEGVVLRLKAKISWRPPAGEEPNRPPTIRLHKGWNFVAVPYPTVGMSCHAVRLELAKKRDKMLQITVGPNPQHGIFMKPNRFGLWGNDRKRHIPSRDGFWIHDTGSATWTPSPTGYGSSRVVSVPVATIPPLVLKLVKRG